MISLFLIFSIFHIVFCVPIDYNNADYSHVLSSEVITNSQPYIKNPFQEYDSLDLNYYPESKHTMQLPILSEDMYLTEDSVPLQVRLGYEVNDIPPPVVMNNHYFRTPFEAEQVPYYEADEVTDLESLNERMGYYENGMYPHVHSSIPAALRTNPVSYLPPVYTTNIHERIPTLEATFDEIDVLNQNSELFSPNAIPRSRRQDDDIFAQWIHDATLNNILPTMPFPYSRGAERNYQTNYNQGGGVAEIPAFLECSPHIHEGALQHYSEHHVPSPAYRVDHQANKNSIGNNHLIQSAKSIANLKPFISHN